MDKVDKGMHGLHWQATKLSGSKSLEQGEKALPQTSQSKKEHSKLTAVLSTAYQGWLEIITERQATAIDFAITPCLGVGAVAARIDRE